MARDAIFVCFLFIDVDSADSAHMQTREVASMDFEAVKTEIRQMKADGKIEPMGFRFFTKRINDDDSEEILSIEKANYSAERVRNGTIEYQRDGRIYKQPIRDNVVYSREVEAR
jgi:hypothetical protein